MGEEVGEIARVRDQTCMMSVWTHELRFREYLAHAEAHLVVSMWRTLRRTWWQGQHSYAPCCVFLRDLFRGQGDRK